VDDVELELEFEFEFEFEFDEDDENNIHDCGDEREYELEYVLG
jgi:hypothetical protein